jgi:rSAM/selenodomain-associated transferase 1
VKAQRHLVVFARAPRLGQVKTRLARDIGDVAALRFYTASLGYALEELGQGPWTNWLCVTPMAAMARPLRLFGPAARKWRIMDQGGGSLGDRMARVFRHLPPGPALIVGSDIPALRHAHVARGFAELGVADTVFGPAEDGGYWLVGARRSPATPDMFRDVRWSTSHALADTLANLGGRFSHRLLEELADVDDGRSWRAWQAGRKVAD